MGAAASKDVTQPHRSIEFSLVVPVSCARRSMPHRERFRRFGVPHQELRKVRVETEGNRARE